MEKLLIQKSQYFTFLQVNALRAFWGKNILKTSNKKIKKCHNKVELS